MIVYRIINQPVPSNTFIVWEEGESSCVIIDPGSYDSSCLVEYLQDQKLWPEYILLTHEHFDHYWGCDSIVKLYGSKIICSDYCKQKVIVPQNFFNKMYFNSEDFCSAPDVYKTIEELKDGLRIGGIEAHFVKTPGHSPGSICIKIQEALFTGDTIMKGSKPVILKRLESSKSDYAKSVEVIFDKFSPNTKVFPGHGESFVLSEVKEYYYEYFHLTWFKEKIIR